MDKFIRLVFLIAAVIVVAWIVATLLKLAAWIISSLLYVAAIIVIIGIISAFIQSRRQQ